MGTKKLRTPGQLPCLDLSGEPKWVPYSGQFEVVNAPDSPTKGLCKLRMAQECHSEIRALQKYLGSDLV